jgi:transcription antitermination factor NusG
MDFTTMIKMVKALVAMNGTEVTEQARERLYRLIKVAEKNGLTKFKEDGQITLFYGPFNTEAATIVYKEDKKQVKKFKVNAKILVSKVVASADY